MANKSDDDYWFTSDTKAFSFEDESNSQNKSKTFIPNHTKSTSTQESNVYYIENKLTDEFQKSDIPLRTVISQQCLDKILTDHCTHKINQYQSDTHITQTVNYILMNMPHSLDEYKSLKSKTELLDSAINTADGNAILTVILFLVNTLKKDIFYKLLSQRRIALSHYINYLSIRSNIKELTSLLTLTEYSSVIGMKLFKITVDNNSNESLKKKLDILYNNHLNKLSNEKDNQIVKYYIELLEWQTSIEKMENQKIYNEAVNFCLGRLCETHDDKAADHILSRQVLSKMQGVSDRQLDWIFLDVKSRNQAWEEIQKMFIKSKWLRRGEVVSGSVSAATVAGVLGSRGAPAQVLERFLALLDPEQGLTLALRFRCHKYVINHYQLQKDRQALVSYKNNLHPQSDHYFLLENAILSLVSILIYPGVGIYVDNNLNNMFFSI